MRTQVFKQHLISTGDYYLTRYYGTTKEDVIAEAEKALKHVDSHRSPNLSDPYQCYMGWGVDLEYYGLN